MEKAIPPLPEVGAVLAGASFGRMRWLADEGPVYDSLEANGNALIDLLAERGVEYVLVGGLAVMHYVEARNTQDIDIVMAVSDLDRMSEVRVTQRDRDFARADFHGVTVDVLFTSNPLFDLVRRNYGTTVTFGSRIIPTATPEGLVLLKLYALPSLYRQGDTRRVLLYESDIRMLIESQGVETGALLDVLGAYVLPTDLRELRALVSDIHESLTRMGARQFEGPSGGGAHP